MLIVTTQNLMSTSNLNLNWSFLTVHKNPLHTGAINPTLGVLELSFRIKGTVSPAWKLIWMN